MTGLLLAVAVVAGYLAGRARPARRASDWARWQTRPTGLRYAAVWTIFSAEDLVWLATHPGRARQAWRARHDPPPPLSPPVRLAPWPHEPEEPTP
ncbi:hypothetical protein LG634_24780 [Streptomyces bambusae]|uniref:hypothetical protein n=1 Tax=Streptomyces bambusae TaxID=1550616 RepID=UPI001CFEB24F|nr:hypothetical protein [Streptomyces bambusae]MCB5168029.1 hypothetical protein [Streptomyces bambusae]